MDKEPLPEKEAPLHPIRADIVLMMARGAAAVGLLLQNHFLPLPAQQQEPTRYVLLAYLVLVLVEALFLWRRWGRKRWPHVTLLVDVLLILAVIYLSGGSTSLLHPLLLLPVVATSIRLGLSAGLGQNAIALIGYTLLVLRDQLEQTPGLDLLQAAAFGVVLVGVSIFGGLLAEQVSLPAREEEKRYQEQIARLRGQFNAANARAHVFYEMARTLSVTLNYQRVLEGILQGCHHLLEFSSGVVLLSASQESLRLVAFSGLRVSDTDKEVHLSGGALSKCLATAEPAILEHMGRDNELGQIGALQRCRSGLCVPLRAGLRNYGVIVVGSVNEKAYQQTDLTQLIFMAHFASIAIQNAQLYQDLRDERDKIISAEEKVRKELSRDLHDGPAQSLAAIAMNVEYIKRLLGDSPDIARQELDSLEQLARRTAWDVRTMLFELRPIILETKGLVSTLEQYVQRFPESERPQVHLDTGGFQQRLDPKTETTVFTIMQEAVNNARRHARAENIWLRLCQQGSNLEASVQDDGVGFDLEAVQASYEKRGSFGLLNMHERAELVGGHTKIASAPGQGTSVTITVPLKRG